MLVGRQVLIDAADILIDVAARAGINSEIVNFRRVGRGRNELQLQRRRWINLAHGNCVAGELCTAAGPGSGSAHASGANAQRIEDRDIRWKHAGAFVRGRDGCCGRRRGPLAIGVIGEEEERLILDHRPAECSPKLVLNVGRINGREVTSRIQILVSEVLVGFSVVVV